MFHSSNDVFQLRRSAKAFLEFEGERVCVVASALARCNRRQFKMELHEKYQCQQSPPTDTLRSVHAFGIRIFPFIAAEDCRIKKGTGILTKFIFRTYLSHFYLFLLRSHPILSLQCERYPRSYCPLLLFSGDLGTIYAKRNQRTKCPSHSALTGLMAMRFISRLPIFRRFRLAWLPR